MIWPVPVTLPVSAGVGFVVAHVPADATKTPVTMALDVASGVKLIPKTPVAEHPGKEEWLPLRPVQSLCWNRVKLTPHSAFAGVSVVQAQAGHLRVSLVPVK